MLGGEVDRLTGRITQFERWYLDGYSGLMADLNTYCNCLLKKDFEHLDENECRSSIETALGRLENLYSDIPFDAIENDVFCSHISVIDELWDSYKSRIRSAVSGGYANEGDLGIEDMAILRACEGLSRCVSLDQRDEITTDYIKKIVPLAKQGAMVIRLDPEQGKELASGLTETLDEMSLLFGDIMSGRDCDRDLAPLIVSKYMVQDLIYFVREFLEDGAVLPYVEIWELTSAAAQVNELFRKRFSDTLERLQMIPGYESFEVEVKDAEGGISKYRNLLWETGKNG